jgi:hypothetical protein
MTFKIKPFWKVIGVKIDLLESTIEEEKHFSHKDRAEQFAEELRNSGYYAIIQEMP